MRQIIKQIKRKLGFLKKLNELLIKEERRELIKVFIVDLTKSLFQSISILSIMPFLSVIMDPNIINNNKYLTLMYDLFGFIETKSFMTFLGVLVLVLLLLGSIISVLTIRVKTSFIWSFNHRLSVSLLKKYLFLPYSYFLNKNSSELGKNILSEVQQLTSSFLQSFLNMLENIIMTIVIFIMLLVVSPVMTLVTLFVLGFLYILIYLKISRKLKFMGRERLRQNRFRYKVVDEAFSSVKYTKVLGKEEYFINSYDIHSKQYSQSHLWSFVISKIPKHIMELIAFGGIIVIALVLLSYDCMSAEIFGLIGLFAFAGYRLMPALQNIYDSYIGFRFHRIILNKIHEDMTNSELVEVSTENTRRIVEKIPFKKVLKLKNISFCYNRSRKKVLKDISLEIKKNSTVAFVGATGSGKTTLVDIILGLLVPQEGEFTVDGLRLTEENVRNWQKNVGYVPQDIYLMDDTVKRNIAFGVKEEDIDDNKVREISKQASIHNFIEKELPNGYDTNIGQRGVRLSGGQRQRIGIARALYHNPEILIFDEATSSLDNITEKVILRAIENISKLKTMIIIAHRLTNVKNCDIVYLIDEGRIIDKGKYKELVERNMKFREMVEGDGELL